MKKTVLFVLIIQITLLSSCGDISMENSFNKKNTFVNFETLYSILNRDILSGLSEQDSINDVKKSTVQDFSEEVKGEFTVIHNGVSLFPEKLVTMMEELIYHNLDGSVGGLTLEEISRSAYFKTVSKLGSEKFILDKEELKLLFPQAVGEGDIWEAYKKISGSENCISIFHFKMNPGEDNYIFVEDSGGSYGTIYISLTQKIKNKFVAISKFAAQNHGYGRVIQFEGNFYYVFMEYNYNLKNYDGIRLYRLGRKAETENLLIKYLPTDYMWKNMYLDRTNFNTELENYFESIKGEITSSQFLEKGSANEIDIFYGDEVKVGDYALTGGGIRNEQIDFANLGVPIYFEKANMIPSSTRNTWYLRSRFYIVDPRDHSEVELEDLEVGKYIPPQNTLRLVQLWFKEIGGKVFTFRLFYVSDYNYIFNVILVEGNQVTKVRTDIVSPKRGFVLTEGERYYSD